MTRHRASAALIVVFGLMLLSSAQASAFTEWIGTSGTAGGGTSTLSITGAVITCTATTGKGTKQSKTQLVFLLIFSGCSASPGGAVTVSGACIYDFHISDTVSFKETCTYSTAVGCTISVPGGAANANLSKAFYIAKKSVSPIEGEAQSSLSSITYEVKGAACAVAGISSGKTAKFVGSINVEGLAPH